ncbi:MAG: oligosaccharide flippase family protein [Butyrivibrio sp.]|nr:oligosaccharide flippase family protein [Butyrivibrio sp.]
MVKIKNVKLFRNAGIYGMGHIFNAAIPFLLMPIMTRYLTPEDYGITAMLAVLMGIYTPFVGLNLNGYVSVAYFKNREHFSLILSTAFGILVVSLCIVSIITFVGKGPIASLSLFPEDWLWVVIFLCMTNFFVTILQNVQQVQGHAKQYTIIQLSQTFMNLILSLFFVVVLSMNWQGRILAQVATGMVFMFLTVILLKRWELLKPVFSKSFARKGLAFGIPMIPHALCGFFVLAADRLFISNMIGLGEVGIFSVGYSLGKAIELLGTSFNKAYSPWLYEKLRAFDEGRSNEQRKLVKYSYLCMMGFIIIAMIYSLFMPVFLSVFVGEKFQGASVYIFGFALASALNAVYYIVVNYIFYQQKTQYLALITFGSGVLHIGITYLMIKAWGAVGAAYAALVTQTIMTIGTWWLSNRVYPMPWKIWRRGI